MRAAIEALREAFLADVPRHRKLMERLVREYRAASEAAGQPAAGALLAPIEGALDRG
jgi:hypothetical protein